MDNADRFLGYLHKETAEGRIEWRRVSGVYLASATLKRNGIILLVFVKKSGDAVSVWLEMENLVIKLPVADRNSLNLLGNMVEKLVTPSPETIKMVERIIDDYLRQ